MKGRLRTQGSSFSTEESCVAKEKVGVRSFNRKMRKRSLKTVVVSWKRKEEKVCAVDIFQ